VTTIPIGAAAVKANPKIKQRCLNLTAAPSLLLEGLMAHTPEHKTGYSDECVDSHIARIFLGSHTDRIF
jgi:hypothetical protein